jgi:7,8-dihydropterin-6-yl-methyl-4-(beta-D-ribofuranosyl)aminobenzene 5'-phosphate synthase
MKIITLAENTALDPGFESIHGLSIYIETSKHKVLFDLGPDDTYLHNAGKLGLDLSEIDTVVISHGHRDHGGALHRFLEINKKAIIYLHRQAFEEHYIKVLFKKISAGLDASLAGNERFIMADGVMRIDEELLLFSDVDGQFETKSNRVLLKRISGQYERDDFAHEQNLIMTAGDKAVLFSGCSHRGVANILRKAYQHQPAVQAVFGGFHLFNPITKAAEPSRVVRQLADELSRQEATFYTGHCTGKQAFDSMYEIMGEKLQHIHSGSIIEL